MKKKLVIMLAMSLTAVALMCGCGKQEEKKQEDVKTEAQDEKREAKTWNMYVAAGMKKPMDVVAGKFMEETGDQININYSSSGALFSQIEQGQPCDLYFTADWIYVDKMKEKDLVESAEEYLSDNVVLVVSESAKDKIKSLDDLKKDDVTLTICDPAAPVGQYAETGLKSMGLWDSVESKIVSRPSTINQAAIMVLQDEVDASLIFSSVANSNGLEAVDVMGTEHTGEIIFATVVVKGGDTEVAEEFRKFAMENIAEFEKYGWKKYEK